MNTDGHGGSWLEVQKRSKDTVIQIFSLVLKFNWFEPYKAPFQTRHFGSGFFINEKGYFVTNFHVVDGAISVQVQIPSLGKQQLDAEIVGVCPEMDISLLRLKDESLQLAKKTLGSISYLPFGNSDNVLRSEEILALGYPLGQEGLKSTQGIVSGREKMRLLSYLQITAPLNPGSSGGPSLNIKGEVIGINFAGIMAAQNVGYIIPINEVKTAIKDLHKVKFLRKAYLGGIFSITNPDIIKFLENPENGGLYIAKVFTDSLLEKAGILEGDMVYELNSYKVDNFGEISVPWSEDRISMFDLLNRYKVGDLITLMIYRKGKKMEISFELQRGAVLPIRLIYPNYEKVDYEIIGGMVITGLNLNLVDLFCEHNPFFFQYNKIDNQRQPKLIITNILHDSQAQRSRTLSPGNIILEVNDTPVGTLDEFRKAIIKSKATNFLTIKTDGEIFTVLSNERILQDEERLSTQYNYPKSELFKTLL